MVAQQEEEGRFLMAKLSKQQLVNYSKPADRTAPGAALPHSANGLEVLARPVTSSRVRYRSISKFRDVLLHSGALLHLASSGSPRLAAPSTTNKQIRNPTGISIQFVYMPVVLFFFLYVFSSTSDATRGARLRGHSYHTMCRDQNYAE